MVTTTTQAQLSPEELQRGWRDAHVKPLWEIPLAHKPDGDFGSPVLWPWRTMEPLVQRAIALASPASAERRVLSLIDPDGHEGDFHTTTNLNAGLQILLPGEVARPHRHSMDALRFVLEGGGATVDQVGQHRPAGDRVQCFRQRRLHPGGVAGGQQNGGGGHHDPEVTVCAAVCQRMDGPSARRAGQS